MERRYYTFSRYLENRFGGNTWKIPVNAGLSCPNRDGVLSKGGCIYCNNNAFFYGADAAPSSVSAQISRSKQLLREQRGAERFMVYFQTFTNTYAPLHVLKEMYDQAAAAEDIVALAVGTRPDCVSPAVLDLLESYSNTMEVWLEYGLQTIHNRTLRFINRGHTYEDFLRALNDVRGRRLNICVHIILGLPGESRADMMKTVEAVSAMGINGIKIHPLQIIRGTELERMHRRHHITTFELEEYVSLVCDVLERLPSGIIIQRLVAESQPELMVAPSWKIKKPLILEKIDRELERRGTCQGAKTVREQPQT